MVSGERSSNADKRTRRRPVVLVIPTDNSWSTSYSSSGVYTKE